LRGKSVNAEGRQEKDVPRHRFFGYAHRTKKKNTGKGSRKGDRGFPIYFQGTRKKGHRQKRSKVPEMLAPLTGLIPGGHNESSAQETNGGHYGAYQDKGTTSDQHVP